MRWGDRLTADNERRLLAYLDTTWDNKLKALRDVSKT